MSIAVNIMLLGVGIPILLSGIVLLITVLQQKNTSTGELSSSNADLNTSRPALLWAGGLALTLAYTAGNVGLLGFLSFSTAEAIPRLFWGIGLMFLLVLFESFVRLPTAAKWSLRALLFAIVLWMMFGSMVNSGTWSASKAAGMLSAMTLLGMLSWWGWDDQRQTRSDPEISWLAMLYGIGLSLVLVEASSAKLAQLCGAMIAGIGVWWFFSLIGQRTGRPLRLAQATIPIFTLGFAGLAYIGHLEADLKMLSGLLVLLAPLLLLLERRFVSMETSWKRLLLRSILLLLPIGIALATLMSKAPVKKDEYDPYANAAMSFLSLFS